MSKYRNHLPQLSPQTFITDGGLETTLIFHWGYELPEFAAFDLLKRPEGYEVLRRYYESYIAVAVENKAGFILESATWRASRDWGRKLGYTPADLQAVNRKSIALLEDLRCASETSTAPMVISGNIGPRGDGYQVENKMSAAEAKAYHQAQIDTLSATRADLVSAFTINYTEEAVGITQAALEAGIPVVISFTLETDGRLPSGQLLGDAITTVDRETGNGPAYYMINCAHPVHFEGALNGDDSWIHRIRAIRANASTKSHAELDAATELDAGDPMDLGRRYTQLKRRLPRLNIFGGCCGTDHRHVAAICKELASLN
jgi:homocysteine S-methyltransferase